MSRPPDVAEDDLTEAKLKVMVEANLKHEQIAD